MVNHCPSRRQLNAAIGADSQGVQLIHRPACIGEEFRAIRASSSASWRSAQHVPSLGGGGSSFPETGHSNGQTGATYQIERNTTVNDSVDNEMSYGRFDEFFPQGPFNLPTVLKTFRDGRDEAVSRDIEDRMDRATAELEAATIGSCRSRDLRD